MSILSLFLIWLSPIVAKSPFDVVDMSHVHKELRFVQMTACLTTRNERQASAASALASQTDHIMLHCPSRAQLEVYDAMLGQTFSSDAPCLFTNQPDDIHTNREGGRMGLTSYAVDPMARMACAPRSITTVVKGRCNGLRSCDVIFELSQLPTITQCDYQMNVDVNYTCIPASSKCPQSLDACTCNNRPRLVCADPNVAPDTHSFVQCRPEGIRSGSLQLAINNKPINTPNWWPPFLYDGGETAAHCFDRDATLFYASLCNRQEVCTINPNMALKDFSNAELSKPSRDRRASTVAKHDRFCSKTSLYLEYTCVQQILLKPLRSKNVKVKAERKTKKTAFPAEPSLDVAQMKSSHPKVEHGTPRDEPMDSSIRGGITTVTMLDSATPPKENQITQAVDEATVVKSPESNHVLLLSIVPSVVCLLLVITLISYVSHQKRASNNHARRHHVSSQHGTNGKSGRNMYGLVQAPCEAWFPGEGRKTFDLLQSQFEAVADRSVDAVGCSDRLAPELPHHWNPMAHQPSPLLTSNCFKCASSAVCTAPLCTLIPNSDRPMQFCATCVSNSLASSPTMATVGEASTERSLLSAWPMQNEKNCITDLKFPHSISDMEKRINSSDSQISPHDYTSVPSPQPPRKDEDSHQSSHYGGVGILRMRQHSSMSSNNARTITIPIPNSQPHMKQSEGITWMTDQKNQIYGSFHQPPNGPSNPIKENNQRFQSSRILGTGIQSKHLAPPLFNGSEMSFTEIPQMNHQSSYPSSRPIPMRIPVVRYPHECETDSDEHEADSETHPSTMADNNYSKDDMVVVKSMSSPRPDLCPSIGDEDRLMQQSHIVESRMDAGRSCNQTAKDVNPSLKPIIQLPIPNSTATLVATNTITITTPATAAAASPRIVPRHKTATFGTSNPNALVGDNVMSPNLHHHHQHHQHNHQSNKTLRFQTITTTTPTTPGEMGYHASMYNNASHCISVPTDMSTSMCRSTQP